MEKSYRYRGRLIQLLTATACVFFFSCRTASVQHDISKKYSVAELSEDFSVLRGALEANHPSLYWYTTKDSLDNYFDAVYNSITDSMTEPEFRNKVAWVVSKIHDGHTAVRFSRRYTNAVEKSQRPVFPLAIKTWEDSLVVLGSAFRGDSVFTRGTIIVSINNLSPRVMLDSMFRFISTDGYTDNFKSQVVSFNFGTHYANAFGLDSLHQIRFLDSNRNVRTVLMRNYDPKSDTLRRKGRGVTQVVVPTRRQLREAKKLSRRSMTIDTLLNTAYIRVATFSAGKLKPFFRRSFKTIHKRGIQSVVFDLRENGGGNIMNSTRLTQYLIKKPFRLADTVAAVSRRFRYGEYIRPSLAYKISMFFTSNRRRSDGRYHFRYFENHEFEPRKKYHFDGDVYLIQGGYSFSATTLFIDALQGQDNVTVIGEETGGGSYGNSAVHLPQIILPNTKIRIILPIYRVVIDASKPKTGRGIFPDIEVKPSSVALKEGWDPKIAKVKELIQQKKK
ncbi:MAG TPA: S41 family peptidase [Chitinophagaceae bacterium]